MFLFIFNDFSDKGRQFGHTIFRLRPNSQTADLGNLIYTPWANVYTHFHGNKLQSKQLKAIKLYEIHRFFWGKNKPKGR